MEMEKIKECTEKIATRLLYVDDEKSMNDVVKRMVEYLGHYIDVAESGMEALNFLEKNHYNILISDIEMPGMHGYELAERIKGVYPMEIIFTTGWDKEKFVDYKEKYGISFILEKPFSMDQLKEILEK